MKEPTKGVSLDARANALVQRLGNGAERGNAFGSMTSTLYDTAWVSMVTKKIDGQTQWLFPETFQYVLDAGTLDAPAGPCVSDASDLLNVIAALLAVKTHWNAGESVANNKLPTDVWKRLMSLTSYVETKLNAWNIEDSQHVGFEMLLPALLGMLEKQGITFDFPGRKALFALRDKKLSRFDPAILYNSNVHTAYHSLEAFIGQIDFDKLKDRKSLDSMLGSPSSTAAYLMNASQWDDAAEAYLRQVVALGEGQGKGGIPGAFPTSIFEVTWVMSTLLENGYKPEDFDPASLQQITTFLEAQLKATKGIVGFMPEGLSDVDDTAKTYLTLSFLGKPIDPTQMIAHFAGKDHFKTYYGERHPSFSANCNALNFLLHLENPAQYIIQIQNAAEFLCECWWNDSVADKWNLSPHYATMLMLQDFSKLLHMWDSGVLPEISKTLKQRIPIAMIQAVNRILRQQRENGSWDDSPEITGYAVLSLSVSIYFPWTELFDEQISKAIKQGQAFISKSSDKWRTPQDMWINKVNYGSADLCEGYCLAAMRPAEAPKTNTGKLASLADVSPKTILPTFKYLWGTPLLARETDWMLKGSLVEGYLFIPLLEETAGSYHLRGSTDNKYMPAVAYTWTCTAYLSGEYIEPFYLWEMMSFTLLAFEIDELDEGFIAPELKGHYEEVKRMVPGIVQGVAAGAVAKSNGTTPANGAITNGSNGHVNGQANGHANGDSESAKNGTVAPNGVVLGEQTLEEKMADVRKAYTHMATWQLKHPGTKGSHADDHAFLSKEIQTYLLAQLDQCTQNEKLVPQYDIQQPEGGHIIPLQEGPDTYWEWVHTTASNHLSGPMAWAFLCCLISSRDGGKSCWPNIMDRYLARDVERHATIISRMLNDYGSMRRDWEERNLNSVNFPEFYHGLPASASEAGQERDDAIRKSLFDLVVYERELLKVAMVRLLERVNPKVQKIMKWHIGVVELWGEVYVRKDLTSFGRDIQLPSLNIVGSV